MNSNFSNVITLNNGNRYLICWKGFLNDIDYLYLINLSNEKEIFFAKIVSKNKIVLVNDYNELIKVIENMLLEIRISIG